MDKLRPNNGMTMPNKIYDHSIESSIMSSKSGLTPVKKITNTDLNKILDDSKAKTQSKVYKLMIQEK